VPARARGAASGGERAADDMVVQPALHPVPVVLAILVDLVDTLWDQSVCWFCRVNTRHIKHMLVWPV